MSEKRGTEQRLTVIKDLKVNDREEEKSRGPKLYTTVKGLERREKRNVERHIQFDCRPVEVRMRRFDGVKYLD